MWWNHEWFRCTPSGTVKLRTRTLNSTTHVQSQKIHAAQRVILARVALQHSIWKKEKTKKKLKKTKDIELRGGRLVATRKRVLLGIEMSVVQASMPTFTATSALAAESKAIPSAFTIFVQPVDQ